MSLEISDNAAHLLLRIWEKLGFAPGHDGSGDWPDWHNMAERENLRSDFLRAPLHKDAIRLTQKAIDSYPETSKAQALKELDEKKMIYNFVEGHHPTLMARSYLTHFWSKFRRDPNEFQRVLQLNEFADAEKLVALWEYQAAVAALGVSNPQNIDRVRSRVEEAKAKHELVSAKYAAIERAKEKLHDRVLGLCYAVLGGVIGTVFTLILKGD